MFGSSVVRERVLTARAKQQARQQTINKALTPSLLDKHCVLGEKEAKLLDQAMQLCGYQRGLIIGFYG